MVKKENKEVEELRVKCQEYLDGWKRAKADYKNLARQSDKKVNDLVEYTSAGIILEVLSIYDHFKLALKHSSDQSDDKWLEGIKHIKKEFEQFLNKFEIEEIKTVGQEFNPEFHEALSSEDSDKDENTVIKEIKPGYKIKDKVLQPAQVIVSNNN